MSAENLDIKMNDADTIRQLLSEEYDATISYRERANTVDNPKAKAVLLDISNEEVSHTGELQELLSEIDNSNDDLVADGKKEVLDMDNEQIEKAYQDFVKADDQPNKTSIEDKLDVLLAQNQEIKVDTERTADAIAEETAGDKAEDEIIGDDFAETNDLDNGLDDEGGDLNLSDDIEGLNESEDGIESEGDITEVEGEANDDSDIEEASGEEPETEESDVIEDEQSDMAEGEQSDFAEEESDVIEDESEAETGEEEAEDADQKKKELEKAMEIIKQLRKENVILKAKLQKQTMSKSNNEVAKPIIKQIKPMDKNLIKVERKTTRPATKVVFGEGSVRPMKPTELVKASDDKLVVGIGKDYKKAMQAEWDLFNRMRAF